MFVFRLAKIKNNSKKLMLLRILQKQNYKGHSINKVNFASRVGNRKALFFQEIDNDGPLIFQKTVNMTFFTDHCTFNFFFIREYVFTLWPVF